MRKFQERKCCYCDRPVKKGKNNTNEMFYCKKCNSYLDRDETYHNDIECEKEHPISFKQILINSEILKKESREKKWKE
jgi:hypothetical protein